MAQSDVIIPTCYPDVSFYLFSSLEFFGFFSAELQSNTKASLQEKDFSVKGVAFITEAEM